MTWRALLRRMLPRKPPSVRLAKPRRMLAMNYDSRSLTDPRSEAMPKLGAVSPPREQLLEVALKRSSQQLEALQVLNGRISQLADRLVGPIPADRDQADTRSDPGNTLGRLDGVQTMTDILLRALHLNMERLERL
jgi:hypothetical protein